MHYTKKYADNWVRRFMATRKEIQKAQRILDETIETLKGNIKCEVFAYDKKGYRVRFFTKGSKLTGGVSVNIPEEWIEDTSPVDNNIREECG